MLKKIVAVAAAAVMTCAMCVTAFAASPTPKAEIKVVDASQIAAEDSVKAGIEEYNAGKTAVVAIPGFPTGWIGYSKVVGLDTTDVQFPAKVTLAGDFTKDVSDISLAYYCTVEGSWHVLKADSVDYANKTATFTIPADEQGYPAVMAGVVVGKVTNSGNGDNGGKSPATGASSATGAFAAAAVILAAGAAVLALRKRNA